MGVVRNLVVSAAALAAVAFATGCGEDDFANEPRPPVPVELTARVNEKVIVSPGEVGAGAAVITVSNQSDDPAVLTFDGPTTTAGSELPPGAVGEMELELEPGDYVVTAGDQSEARAGKLDVGPERETSQNDLLLP